MLPLGRKPRAFNPNVPHMSALLAGRFLPPPPISVDNSKGASDFGMMLNDTLQDCTCAAYYHARQVWSLGTTGHISTDPDRDVLDLYEGSCGYQPSNPTTDTGGVMQEVLTYLLNKGAKVQGGVDKILAFVEVDPRNIDDVKRTIAGCGVAYTGIGIPGYIADADDPPPVWKYERVKNAVRGGHAITLTGYDLEGFEFISWGKKYRMTTQFFCNFTDELYAIADKAWISARGVTPAGLSIQQLEQQMQGLRDAE